MSAKNRRKEEKKKTDLRPGGYYENIALMRALYILYDEIYFFKKEVNELCLIEEHGQWEFCKQLMSQFVQLKNNMSKRLNEIWTDAFMDIATEPAADDFWAQACIFNREHLGMLT